MKSKLLDIRLEGEVRRGSSKVEDGRMRFIALDKRRSDNVKEKGRSEVRRISYEKGS